MSKRVVLNFIFLMFPLTISSEPLLLTPPFYSIKDTKPINKLTINTTQPTFYIIVPESYTLPSDRKQTLEQIESFTKNVKIPTDFFTSKNKRETPYVIFLDWKEQESINGRKKIGDILAKKINDLQHRFKSANFILLSSGQGANVINHASDLFRKPVDIVIQLAPPVFKYRDLLKNKAYETFYPNEKNIKKLFTFHSDHEICMMHPTLHPTYKHYYHLKTHKNHQNALLLINNDHPLPVDIMCPLVGTRILTLCKKMNDLYPHHNHLITHISNTKKTTDMMVLLRDGDTVTTDKKLAPVINKERIMSNAQKKQFQTLWGRPLKLSLSQGEVTRKSYDTIKKLAEQVKVS